MEVKSGEGTVVVADRNRYSDVWDKINDTKADIQKVESTVQEAKAGIYKDISDAARGVTSEVAGVSRQVQALGNKTA